MPALHRKLQRKLQNLIRNWTSQWLNWSSGLNVILHGPLATTGLYVQHASVPNVPMIDHNSTRKQKSIILIEKSSEFKEGNGPFALNTCKFLNLTWKPVAYHPHPKTLEYSQSILITKAFSGCIPKEMRLSCQHYCPFICSMVSFVSLLFLSPQRLQKLPDRQGRGKELWALGGKSRYKNP